MKTEPNYFRALAADLRVSVAVRVEGLGDNTDSLVARALEISGADDYEQAWCVFDRDSFPPGRFNRAIQMAEGGGLRVACSNEAFELWYVLHFEFLTSGLPRGDYGRKIAHYLGAPYRKNHPALYRMLRPRQAIAVQNAARLLERYRPHSPEQDNPSTRVHLLVQELEKYRRG